jgi:hypothetical protein
LNLIAVNKKFHKLTPKKKIKLKTIMFKLKFKKINYPIIQIKKNKISPIRIQNKFFQYQ